MVKEFSYFIDENPPFFGGLPFVHANVFRSNSTFKSHSVSIQKYFGKLFNNRKYFIVFIVTSSCSYYKNTVSCNQHW
jgi:hypothetical protein